jgi:hypothetical protein
VTADARSGPIQRLLGDDHARLAELLSRGLDDAAAYAAFRSGLLRHIGMEEKVLLPAARRARGGQPLPAAARLRLDHGALAALLVPSPTRAIVRAIRGILARHNPIEEGPEGVYADCERLAGADLDTLMSALKAFAVVPVSAHVDSELAMSALRRALARAGYTLEDFEG